MVPMFALPMASTPTTSHAAIAELVWPEAKEIGLPPEGYPLRLAASQALRVKWRLPVATAWNCGTRTRR